MSSDPFTPAASSPFGGLTPNLIPNPPGEIPAVQEAGNAVAGLSPFREALDVDAIIKNLVLDRPLKLYIPDREKFPEYEFRIINSIPQEIADAHNKGFREVTDEKLVGLFTDLVAGTDAQGKAYRPMLMARPVAVGNVIRKRKRKQLADLYAGMDPANKEFSSKYAEKVDAQAGTKASFSGPGFRIRV